MWKDLEMSWLFEARLANWLQPEATLLLEEEILRGLLGLQSCGTLNLQSNVMMLTKDPREIAELFLSRTF